MRGEERVATTGRLWNDYLLLHIVLSACAALRVLVGVGPAISLSRLDTVMEGRGQR